MYGSQRIGYIQDEMYLGKKTGGKVIGGNIGLPSMPNIPIPNPFLLPGSSTLTPLYFGKKRYELNDWLGNVRVVINDRKTPVNTGSVTVSYRPQVVSVSDYYSFGSEISERSYEYSNEYRFGFNSHEKMNEVYGKGNFLSFGDNGYNTRLAVRWNVEPMFKKYPYWSGYSVFGRNPVKFMDKDGNEIVDPQGRRAVEIVEGKITFTEYATDDIKRVVNAMQLTKVGTEQAFKMIQSENKIQIEIDKEHNEVYFGEKGKIVFNKEEARNPNEFILGQTKAIDEYENIKKVDVEKKLPDVKITLYEKTIEKYGETNNLEINLGATATHESVHATDKSANREWLRFHDKDKLKNSELIEQEPRKKAKEFYDEYKNKK